MTPLFLVFFFGIFHLFGGLAFGRGLRDLFDSKEHKTNLILWGALMGITPTLFDWFFLIRDGQLIEGLIGPAIFILSTLISAIFLTAKLTAVHEKSIGAILMGGCALMFGLLLAPYLYQQAFSAASTLQRELELADYLFGSCLLILPLLVGTGFIWNGVQAILKNRSFDEHMQERELEIEEKTSKKKKSKS